MNRPTYSTLLGSIPDALVCSSNSMNMNLLIWKYFRILNFMEPFKDLQYCQGAINHLKHLKGQWWFSWGGRLSSCTLSIPVCFCHHPPDYTTICKARFLFLYRRFELFILIKQWLQLFFSMRTANKCMTL